MSNYDECVKNGYLRAIPPLKEKSQGSMNASLRWIEEAKLNLETGALGSSIMSSYLVMFHSARAILYLDGFREKNHYCLARYLEEKYVKRKLLEKSWIELLDFYREVRHDNQYSFSFFATKNDA
ncbi:MAG: hypothetical protein DDT41_00416 [candidate division WS2 bacterium]|nr:hypothetical protein [Candidatus Psychracetigena formicireducens]